MQKIIIYTLLIIISMVTHLQAQDKETFKQPKDWSPRETKSGSYEIGIAKDFQDEDKSVYTIKSVVDQVEGFGNLMETITSKQYLGKTIKMSAYIKSKEVESYFGLWMRVDEYSSVLAFDNMSKRQLKGTNDWEKYEIVLFVPEFATSISYGVLLEGKGQIWIKDVSYEIVGDKVAETGLTKGRNKKSSSFEKRAKAISMQIDYAVQSEKKALKEQILMIDKNLEEGIISKNEALELKQKAADESAKRIEEKVATSQQNLEELIQQRLDGLVKYEEENKKGGHSIILGSSSRDSIGGITEYNIGSFKIYAGEKDKMERKSKRTTSQFVFAGGLNNLITEGENLENSDYRVWGSHFYEWGLTYNSRILKNNNLLHAKYGLSVMYNNLRPTDNRYFVRNGDQTELQTGVVNYNESRFRNVYLVAPVHLEFDFTPKKTNKEGETYFRTHESFRLGIGGYGGFRVKSKQILKYEIDGNDFKDKQKGNFNVSDFIYGVSAYVGYGQTSLYVKYDMNPMFKNNAIKQNNVSLGIRFDFN